MVSCYSAVEKLAASVAVSGGGVPLGNSSVLSLDPTVDKTALHSQIIQTYKWTNKVGRYNCSYLQF